jgi:hypothetical protein
MICDPGPAIAAAGLIYPLLPGAAKLLVYLNGWYIFRVALLLVISDGLGRRAVAADRNVGLIADAGAED